MSDSEQEMRSKAERTVVYPPFSREYDVGLGVSYNPNPGPHGTEYTIDQLWPGGDAETVYVGDKDDVLELMQTLAEVLQADA